MYAGFLVIAALGLMICGMTNDYLREQKLRKRRKELDRRFYEANKKLSKYFPMAAKEMQVAYENKT